MSHVGPVPGRRIGEYELLDEVSRSGMSLVCRARHLPTGRIVTLQVEAKVLAEGPSSLILRPDGGDLPGWRIPGYEFLKKLCDGSMGRVYLARQVSVDRKVAIKVLRESRARNKEFIERYRREARLAARLSHPNVVTTLDAGEVDGHHYIVMEYIEGETVQEILDDGYVFEEDEAIEVVLRVSEALKHVHAMGLIHRDVKPANVMLRPDGLVKLIDLGLARSIDDEDWMASEAGMAVGTPEFISPEQVRGQTDVDIRADIYSLGATLYAMVTGTVPHPGTNPREVMHKHVDRHAVPIPPDQHNDRLSEAMVAIITRMMARNRDERFPYLDQVIASLDQVKATNGREDDSESADSRS
jgi:serine/threonine-protein kinase